MTTRIQAAITGVGTRPGKPGVIPTPIVQPPTGTGEVILDVLEGNAEFEHTTTRLRGTRNFVVTDVSGAGARIFANALRAPGIPVMGEAWPGFDTLLVTGRTVRLLEGCTTKFNIEIRYGFPEVTGGPWDNPPDDQVHPVLELDSTVVMKRTNVAIGPNNTRIPIQIEGYHASEYDPDTGEPIGTKAEAEPIQGGMVDVPVTLTVMRFMRREPPIDSQGRAVANKSRTYTGKTNSTSIDGTGETHTWLCTRLGGITDDGGESYNMTYEFTHNPDKWRATAVYIDPKTGQPGDNISITDRAEMSGNGVKTFQVVGSANFHDLDLYLNRPGRLR